MFNELTKASQKCRKLRRLMTTPRSEKPNFMPFCLLRVSPNTLILRGLFSLFWLLATAQASAALQKKTFCIWDPVGRNGPVMSFYSDVIPKAQAWGYDIAFRTYTDEKVAANDFKAEQCEAVLLSAILSRQFNKFGGTMDAIGGIDSPKGLELMLATLARPKAGKLMSDGEYEVIATFPVGAMYAFVRDKEVRQIEDFAGKKISVLNGDPQARMFANLAGATPVNTSLSNFAGLFNNGQIDILLMPALAYNTFELYRGLSESGGILKQRLYYGMLQVVARQSEFDSDFGKKMRKYVLARLKDIDKLVSDAEAEIPSKYWIPVQQYTKDEIDFFSKQIRVALKKEDTNHPKALKLMWKIRCRLDRSRGECNTPE